MVTFIKVLKTTVWLSRKYNWKYVGFMVPLAKKIADPCVKSLFQFDVQDIPGDPQHPARTTPVEGPESFASNGIWMFLICWKRVEMWHF